MSQTIIDPEEVRRFATNLTNHKENLEYILSEINSQFQALGETWQDAQYQRFAEVLEDSKAILKKFIDESDRFSVFLHEKARRVEEYQAYQL